MKQYPVFNDGKLFHGGRRNAVVISRSGEIGLFSDDIKEIKILNVKDIKSIRYEKTGGINKTLEPVECFCIFSINDFNNPIIKIRLAFYEEGNANDLYNEIKQLYTIVKENHK